MSDFPFSTKLILKIYGWMMFFGVGIFTPLILQGAPPPEMSAASVSCGVLEKFEGEVQLMDSSRDHVLTTAPKTIIPCMGWVSVQNGWAEVKHKQGFRVRFGSNSFAQIFDHSDRGSSGEDHVVLFRGQAYFRVLNGVGEVRVQTANARARIPSGQTLVIYKASSEETQLVALTQKASLENRFEPSRRVNVIAGESTQMSLKLMRTIPTAPSALNLASLKEKLWDLNMEIKNFKAVVHVAQERKERKTLLQESQRSPASEHAELTHRNPSAYVRHEERPEDGALRKHALERLTGGKGISVAGMEEEAEKPVQKAVRQPASMKILVADEDPGLIAERNRRNEEEKERKALLNEIARLHGED